MHRRTLIAVLATLPVLPVLPVLPARAQAETRRVRGTVEKVEGPRLQVKTRDGEDLVIVAPMGVPFTAVLPATVTDLKPGTFVGSGARAQPDGSLVALEVHIFPESMRGTGEGHRPWDGGVQGVPNTTMTNASIDTTVAAVHGGHRGVDACVGHRGVRHALHAAVPRPVTLAGAAHRLREDVDLERDQRPVGLRPGAGPDEGARLEIGHRRRQHRGERHAHRRHDHEILAVAGLHLQPRALDLLDGAAYATGLRLGPGRQDRQDRQDG